MNEYLLIIVIIGIIVITLNVICKNKIQNNFQVSSQYYSADNQRCAVTDRITPIHVYETKIEAENECNNMDNCKSISGIGDTCDGNPNSWILCSNRVGQDSRRASCMYSKPTGQINAFCFKGGGYKAMGHHYGLMLGIINTVSMNLDQLFTNITNIGGNSGGSWTVATLFMSDINKEIISRWVNQPINQRDPLTQIMGQLYYDKFIDLYKADIRYENNYSSTTELESDLQYSDEIGDGQNIIDMITNIFEREGKSDVAQKIRNYLEIYKFTFVKPWRDHLKDYMLAPVPDILDKKLSHINTMYPNITFTFPAAIHKSGTLLCSYNSEYNNEYNTFVYDSLIPNCCKIIESYESNGTEARSDDDGSSSVNCPHVIPIILSNDNELKISNQIKYPVTYYKRNDPNTINGGVGQKVKETNINLANLSSDDLYIYEACACSSAVGGAMLGPYLDIQNEIRKISTGVLNEISNTDRFNRIFKYLSKLTNNNLVVGLLQEEISDDSKFSVSNINGNNPQNSGSTCNNIDRALLDNNPVMVTDGGFWDNGSICSVIKAWQKDNPIENELNILYSDCEWGMPESRQGDGNFYYRENYKSKNYTEWNNYIYESVVHSGKKYYGLTFSFKDGFHEYNNIERRSAHPSNIFDHSNICNKNGQNYKTGRLSNDRVIWDGSAFGDYSIVPGPDTQIFNTEEYWTPSYISNDDQRMDGNHIFSTENEGIFYTNECRYVKWESTTIENNSLGIQAGTPVTIHMIEHWNVKSNNDNEGPDISILPTAPGSVDALPAAVGGTGSGDIGTEEYARDYTNISKARALNISKFINKLIVNNPEFKEALCGSNSRIDIPTNNYEDWRNEPNIVDRRVTGSETIHGCCTIPSKCTPNTHMISESGCGLSTETAANLLNNYLTMLHYDPENSNIPLQLHSQLGTSYMACVDSSTYPPTCILPNNRGCQIFNECT
jgi:hypothetical protein